MTGWSPGRRQLLMSAGALLAAAGPASVVAGLAGAELPPEALIARTWDYIIVGGGSAGCVLAWRLSEDPAVRVLLLEAGVEATDPAVFRPAAWPELAGGALDWKDRSTLQPGLLGRTLNEPRGKGLGGSTLAGQRAKCRTDGLLLAWRSPFDRKWGSHSHRGEATFSCSPIGQTDPG